MRRRPCPSQDLGGGGFVLQLEARRRYHFSQVSLRLAGAKEVLAETSMLLPWNLGPLCLAQSGIIYHLLVPASFWTCAPTVALSVQHDSEQYLGHDLLCSLNFSQWASHDPHLHLLSEVPLMLCTFICCSFLVVCLFVCLSKMK